MKMKFKRIPFTGRWFEALGQPESSGIWFVYGDTGNGKTSFLLQLARALCEFERVIYDSMEEGARLSFQVALQRVGIGGMRRKLLILDKEPLDELLERLRKRRSPRIVIIDSVQHAELTRAKFKEIKREFPNHLFIFISHADGKRPKGSLADFMLYDADVKIRVEGYKAMIKNRVGGESEYIIWHEGAIEYWG